MRRAKRLGFPGLVAFLLLAGGLLLGAAGNATKVSAQTPGPLATATGTKTCVQPFQGGGGVNNSGIPLITDCTLTFTVPSQTGFVFNGGTVAFQDILTDPNACFVPNFVFLQQPVNASPICSNAVQTVGTPPEPIPMALTPVFTACPAPGEQISLAGNTSTASGTLTVTCTLPPIAVTGPTNLCEIVDITLTGSVGTGSILSPAVWTNKIQVCPPNPIIPPPVVNPLTGIAVTKTCFPLFAGASTIQSIVTDCTLVFTTSGQFNNGTHLEFDQIIDPNATFVGGTLTSTTICENGVGGGGILSANNTIYTCVVGPINVTGVTGLCEMVQILDPFGNSSPKLKVCPPGPTPPTPTSGLTGFTVTKKCDGPTPAVLQPGGTTVTDCILTFTAAAGTSFPAGTFVADDTITSPGAAFSSTATALNGVELTGTASAGPCLDAPTTGVLSGFTITCHLPPIVLTTFPNQVCETVELGSVTLGFSTKQQVCGFAATPPTPPAAVSPLQPTTEAKTCTNAVISGNTVGTTTGTNFTLQTFPGAASNCVVQLQRGGVNCGTNNPCADGTVIVTLTTPGSAATISCGGASNAAATTPCQPSSNGTVLQIPCGTTAPNVNPTVLSNTCSNVNFNIASALGNCILNPTGCVGTTVNGNNFNPTLGGATATVTISFLATGGNRGVTGGVTLGTNIFTFQGAGTGTLLVTATPQLIPSNGTLASVVTATFACGNSISLINGFPLSSQATNGQENQPVLGTNQNTICGAGLAGTFTFATTGPVLFDNGRSSEVVPCGASAQNNLFGGVNPFNPLGLNPTAPLAFTCTGAAVLAIGSGSAGDAPINITFSSGIGGLTAIGSTLITVSPSGAPVLSVNCSPNNVDASGNGSICIATVTDQNGTPLGGMTGAAVTFSSSDTTKVTLIACGYGMSPGAAFVTTISPGGNSRTTGIPALTAYPPCQLPAAAVPTQVATFVNGQAAATAVSSPNAAPGTVTVSATIGALLPPLFNCMISPYVPTPFFQNTSGVGLPAVTGCGSGSPVGFSGIATALSSSAGGSALAHGTVLLPNAASASTTLTVGPSQRITIVGASAQFPGLLGVGCNQVIVTSSAGARIRALAALVANQGAVTGIWRYNNASGGFQAGYFNDNGAPVDFSMTGTDGVLQSVSTVPTQATQVTETYFICVNGSTSINSN